MSNYAQSHNHKPKEVKNTNRSTKRNIAVDIHNPKTHETKTTKSKTNSTNKTTNPEIYEIESLKRRKKERWKWKSNCEKEKSKNPLRHSERQWRRISIVGEAGELETLRLQRWLDWAYELKKKYYEALETRIWDGWLK